MTMIAIFGALLVLVLWGCFIGLIPWANKEIRRNPDGARMTFYLVAIFFFIAALATGGFIFAFFSLKA